MRRCLALLLLLLVSACAQLSADSQTPAAALGAPNLQLPFPSREPSGLTEYELDGTDTELRSAGASEIGTALVLDGVSSGFEYGVYRFNLLTDDPDSVSVLLEEFATSGAWVGVANYTTDRWEFDGPFTKQKTFVIDDPAFISPAGNIWVAVVTASQTATVNALSVRTIRPNNQLPVANVVVDVDTGNAPLTVQFDASASVDTDGELIEFAWDFNGDGLYDGFSDLPFATHVFTTPGLFQVRLRVTDDQFARATTTVDVNVNAAGNVVPVANVIATPNDGETPLFASLDASASFDPDGSIVVYDWDYQSDGIWDDFNTGPFVIHSFTTVGLNTASVRLTDNSGAQTIGTVQVTVQGWLPAQLIGDTGTFNTYCSIGEANGIPAIAYYDGTGQDLMFKKAADPYGDNWNVPQAIDTTGNVGQHTSMATVNGNPAIAYQHGGDAKLRFIRSADVDGVNWNAPIVLDTGAVVGVYNSLAVVNGNPAVSYYVFSGNDLKYVRANDPDGTSWGTPVTVASTGDVGQYTSLAVVNGRPAISYLDVTNNDLMYVRATDADGASWDPPVTVDAPGAVGLFTSMEVVNGRPAISYRDQVNGYLKYVRASDVDGVSWDTPLILDMGNCQYTSLAIINGTPGIAYAIFDGMGQADLRFVGAVDPDGTSWNMPLDLDTVVSVGWYAALAEINGKGMVCYQDFTNQDLKFVRRF